MSGRSQESYADLVAARAPALLRLAYLLTGNVTDAEISGKPEVRTFALKPDARGVTV